MDSAIFIHAAAMQVACFPCAYCLHYAFSPKICPARHVIQPQRALLLSEAVEANDLSGRGFFFCVITRQF